MESAVKAAVLYKANTPLEVVELNQEGPKAGEARVKVKAAGICHSDWHIMNGDWTPPLPMVLGHEAAGIVEEVGAGVTNVKPGDHVIFSFRPQCGRCLYCSMGRSILCDGHASPRWGMLDGTFRLEAQRAGHLPDGAHRNLLREGGVPGRDAGADPQGDAVAAGGPDGLLRAHRRRRGHPLRGGGGGRRPCSSSAAAAWASTWCRARSWPGPASSSPADLLDSKLDLRQGLRRDPHHQRQERQRGRPRARADRRAAGSTTPSTPSAARPPRCRSWRRSGPAAPR